MVRGKVIIGNSGAELGVRGYVSAYDAGHGKLVWRFYTVPGNPADGPDDAASDEAFARFAGKTWNGKWWEMGGGGTVWDSIVYDPEFDLLLIGVGNGSPVEPPRALGGQGRQPVPLLDRRARSRHRRLQVALPGNPGRDVGLHRHPADHARRPHDRRQGRARC